MILGDAALAYQVATKGPPGTPLARPKPLIPDRSLSDAMALAGGRSVDCRLHSLGIGLTLFGKARFELKPSDRDTGKLDGEQEWALRTMKSTVR